MAKLTAKERRKLKPSEYVYPKSRSYPIPDESHAKAALFMAARKDTKADPEKVKRAVRKKFPRMLKKNKKRGG